MVKISGVIMARNEETNIEDAIKSLNFTDQIVVTDTGSTDNTLELAKKAGAEVYHIEFAGFGKSKQKSLEYCDGEWIIFLDADERVSPELAKKLKSIVESNTSIDGYKLNRLTYFLGKPIKHSGWYPDYVTRFFKKDKGKFNNKMVHESIEIEGEVGRVDEVIEHYSYKNLEQYIDKANEYSTLSALEMAEEGKRFGLINLIFRPIFIFFKMFVIKLGFLDGLRGFLLAVLSSYHVFLKYAKLKSFKKI
jgi:glycosyltransferase involved in cell wall biosynthesis